MRHSIPTMDSDYNHVPTGGCSLSDAGGTMGSQNQSLSNFSNAASAFGSMAPSVAKFGTGSLAGDSVERRDMNYYGKQYSLPQREEMLEIYAPSGKLGLVIDTPNDTTSTTTTPIVRFSTTNMKCVITSVLFPLHLEVACEQQLNHPSNSGNNSQPQGETNHCASLFAVLAYVSSAECKFHATSTRECSQWKPTFIP